MKCGDIVLNHWAGPFNLIRFFVFIEDNGECSKVIHFNGKRLTTGNYYSADLKTDEFEVVGHIPLKETIKSELLKRLGVSDA